jgi:signal transduction histidine kinase/phage shock protein PspC (stress-responsive transcriptional regulator)
VVPPKLFRATRGQLVAGVARGLAEYLRVNVVVIRVAFVALTFAAGAGIVMYAAFWVFVPAASRDAYVPRLTDRPNDRLNDPPSERLNDRHQYLAIGALTAGGVLAVQSLGLGLPGELLWPLALTGFGAAVLWKQADEARRDQWRQAASGRRRPLAIASVVGGALLVVAGAATFLAYHGQLSQISKSLLSAVVIVTGVAVITGPWWLGTIRQLATERRARIREQERAELAAHLHDSVLHTLALIQRNVDDPREVHRLARSQERELRTWLYRPPLHQESDFGRALERIVGDVEDAHGVTIELVVVGEGGIDDGLSAMLQAAREAMVNAAKHAQSEAISVYAEIEAAKVTVFVRDRGAGFDPAAVPSDRLGVKESIIGRMERHGGQAIVRTSPGAGTEVRLEMTSSMARA